MVDAREYHEETDHTPERLAQRTFSLDRSNQPRPYKVYTGLPERSLPDPAEPAYPALAAIATSGADPPDDAPSDGDESAIDPRELHALCHCATGVTKELERQGRRLRYRAASCTGKLYHVDLYAVAGRTGDLDPGVYHFDPETRTLDVLREGDYRGVLAAAAGSRQAVGDAPVTFVATSQWWRNAWKYRERTYRHAFWDSGTILANLLATAHGRGHRAEVVTGFADDPVVELLGLDPDEEAPLELVPVGEGSPAVELPPVERIDPDEEPLSDDPVEYPLIPDAWRQSRLDDGDAAAAWRGRLAECDPADLGLHGAGDGETVELDPVDRETASARPLANTIERRGSLREYAREPISRRKFATVLDRALRGVPLALLDGEGPDRLCDCYCLVHAVEGVDAGAYQYHPERTELERIGDTDRETAARLGLGQDVVGDAAANVYLTADVDAVVERLGNRGYRAAQLAGGIALGRLYLATYAHRTLGGRGFTFHDRLVSDHLSPRAENQAPMTMFAFGTPPA